MNFFEMWNERLFGDIGSKLKKIALVFYWILLIGCWLTAIIFLVNAFDSYDEDFYFSMFFCFLVGGPISAWILSVGLYAIGEHLYLLQSINAHARTMRKHFCGDTQPSYAKSYYSTTHSGWTCGKCGEKYAAHVRYCAKCGMPGPMVTPEASATPPTPAAPVVQRTSNGDWICKKCGTANTNATTYCKDCGEYK